MNPGEPTPPFGVLLRQWREATGLTQEQLAERAGLTAKAVSALERGERRYPYPHTVQALMGALGLEEAERTRMLASIPRRDIAARFADATADASADTVVPAFTDHDATLSAPPTALIGRAADVSAIVSRLQKRTTRLLTLVGPGGVGKTRLALECAAHLKADYMHGAAVVALAPVPHAPQVIPTIAAVVGLRPAAGQPVTPLVHEYLRSRTMLLVLDNFEHLLPAATDISALMATCPTLTILVTSRAPLQLRGEQEYPVAPLAVPTLAQVPRPEDIEAVPAIQLFVQRAHTVSPHFELTQSNATAIAAICRRLDGLPLALELAAARVKLLTPTALLARLDQALPLLVGGARDLPERQQTMRQTVAWSYELLTATEQTLFRRLGVFVGGWSLSAAEAVCGEGDIDILEGLASLQNNSLVVRVDHTDRSEPRFAMLETIRDYAREQWTPADAAQLRTAHAEYIYTLVKTVSPFFEVKSQAFWLFHIAEEYNNIRAAIKWWSEQGNWQAIAEVGWALRFFMGIRGYIREGQEWFEAVLAQGDAVPAYWRVRALGALGLFMQQSGKSEAGSAYIRQARALMESDPAMEMYCDIVDGLLALQATHYDVADGYFDRAITGTTRYGYTAGLALAHIGKGYLAVTRHDWERAGMHLQSAVTPLRAIESWWNLAFNLNVMGTLAYFSGDIFGSEPVYREALELTHHFGDTWAMVFALEGIGRVRVAQGALETGTLVLAAAANTREQSGTEGYGTPLELNVVRHLNGVLRDQLGDARFETLRARGRAMPLDDVVALALADP